MRRSPADSTNRSLAAFGKLQHIPEESWTCGERTSVYCIRLWFADAKNDNPGPIAFLEHETL